MTDDKAIVIVCEPRARWTPQLQHQFLDEWRVRGCRSVASLEKLLSDDSDIQARRSGDVGVAGLVRLDAGRSVVVLDFSVGAAGCLQFLGQQWNRPVRPPIVAIASEPMAELEWIVRELGAVEFIGHWIGAEDLAHLCRRIVCPPTN